MWLGFINHFIRGKLGVYLAKALPNPHDRLVSGARGGYGQEATLPELNFRWMFESCNQVGKTFHQTSD